MYVETHPFEEFVPKGAKALIVGSFPPIRLTVQDINDVSGSNEEFYTKYFQKNQEGGSDINFYYGSKENKLWELIGKIFDEDLSGKENKKNFLDKKGIGITDIIQRCHRRPRTQNGVTAIDSFDKSLKIFEYRDVIKTIKDNGIQKVFCTSKYVLNRLERLDRNKTLCNVDVIALPSPSRSFYRSAWRNPDFKPSLGEDKRKYADEYRLSKYNILFDIDGATCKNQ